MSSIDTAHLSAGFQTHPSDMRIKYARLNISHWGVPYPGPIANGEVAEKILGNKARVKRLIDQWNRWCDSGGVIVGEVFE